MLNCETIRKYIENGERLPNIAKLLNVGYTKLYNFCKNHSIKHDGRKRKRNIDECCKLQKDDIIEIGKLYQNGKTLHQLALLYGVTDATILSYIRKLGIKTRFKSGLDVKYTPKIQKDTLEKLYLIDGLSTYDIAKLYDYPNQEHIIKALNYYDIPKRNYSQASFNMYKQKPEIKQKILDAMYENRVAWLNKIPTKLEIKFMDWCNDNDIEYIFQYIIEESDLRHRFDFHIIGTNIIVEMDGNYWHSSEYDKFKDKFFDKTAEKFGYNVIRISDIELKENKDVITEKLSGYVNRRTSES